jgi:histidinol-phosphate phosphatase family protein
LPSLGNRRAIFLDRDGVINRRRVDHVKSWAEFEFLPTALEALRLLRERRATTVVITNQSAVGRGLLSEAELDGIHGQMLELISSGGGEVAAVYACPHLPEAGCGCRKPAIGLLERAAEDLGLNLSGSVLVGDSESDIGAARAAGCRPVLLSEGAEPGWRDGLLVVPDLQEAVLRLNAEPVDAAQC